MAHLVVGNPAPLGLAENTALFFNASDNPFNRGHEILKANVLRFAAGRGNRGLIDQVCQIGASKSRRQTGDFVQVDVLANPNLANVDLQDREPARAIRSIDQDLAIEASGSKQRLVQYFRTV